MDEESNRNEGRWRDCIRQDPGEPVMSLDFIPSRQETIEGFRQETDMI